MPVIHDRRGLLFFLHHSEGTVSKMKRSIHVSAPFLAAMALAISTGCRKPQMQRCVDEQNHVVDPSFCKNLPQNPNQQNSPPGYFPYRFYYGGSGGYGIGSTATGGGYIPSSGVSYSTTSGVSSRTSRGGFGSSFGGGDSGSGAHGGSGGE